ncbi:hypothetical protein FHG87_008749 [Trinorchestia longiramus]|nr:hypothetical protein FHG87_008749 [Trinorchestia longiramus]
MSKNNMNTTRAVVPTKEGGARLHTVHGVQLITSARTGTASRLKLTVPSVILVSCAQYHRYLASELELQFDLHTLFNQCHI